MNLRHVIRCKKLHFVKSYMKQNKNVNKVESVQHRMEFIFKGYLKYRDFKALPLKLCRVISSYLAVSKPTYKVTFLVVNYVTIFTTCQICSLSMLWKKTKVNKSGSLAYCFEQTLTWRFSPFQDFYFRYL